MTPIFNWIKRLRQWVVRVTSHGILSRHLLS